MASAFEERAGVLTQCPSRADQAGDGQERECDSASVVGPCGSGRGVSGMAAPSPGHEVLPRARSCASSRRLVCAYNRSSSAEVRMSAPSRVEPSSKWTSTGTDPCRALGS